MERQASFEIDLATHMNAQRLHQHVQLRSKRALRGYLILSAVYSVLFVGVAMLSGSRQGDPWWIVGALFAGPVVGAIVCGLMQLVHGWMLPRRITRVHAQHHALRDPMRIAWDDSQFTLEGESGSTRLAWGRFVQWAEARGMILLYQTDNLFNLIPEATLSAEQRGEIVAALEGAGVKRVGPRA
ncbi:YcxB family protein [Sphingomonas sp. HF-S4]|uniref:YcxB family protein n=1 Tax=Sphingomonas agrestis TaxID=3080540 RepID=A0ABU3YBW7_9SPHN|nr:YcxB family protein [Sphingomonas sp. HF-S4]MDV3458889.1 YcxB family protein [Sphingomonas sp. HF-S4]